MGIVGLALGRPVLLVVPASVFSRFRGPILGCQPVMAPVCVASRPGGVFGVRGGSACGPSTLCTEHCFRFVPDTVGFCRSRFPVFGVPAALAGEGLVIPTGPCSRGSPLYFFQLGARRRGSSVSDGLQRRLWRLLLAAVFSLMVRVVWLFGLCILVKVLPRIALCRFWWRFFLGVLRVCFGPPLCCSYDSKCAVWLCRILVRFSQDGSWCFLVEVLPKAVSCCFGCRCSLSLCGDELSLFPVGLYLLQSAWALSVKVLSPWPCVWLPRWPACLVVRFQVSRPRWWDLCVPVA
ncbi:hypothetical protein Taro_046941 [Colocasia esculenta]|uniref:Uncharacterized protein n=1 Tax=Colocasia esculenta TaxID=4460 RepID=A0A843WRE4_COLES|nr:hypothetical protein [Colocasia esculenta]